MDRGTYTAASAGLAQLRKLEVVTNNLANANTVGFKRAALVGSTQSFDQTLARTLDNVDPTARPDQRRYEGVVNVRTVTDFSPGAMQTTGNPFDVALKNQNDFFVVESPQGPVYTRAGNFTLNEAGELVNPEGYRVLGDGGPLAVNGVGAYIADDGSVRGGGATAGRLQVVHFDDPQNLERVAGSSFRLPAGQPAPQSVTPEIASRTLEMANVSAISSMVDLITAQRAFQLYAKSAESIDGMNQIAINQVGRRS